MSDELPLTPQDVADALRIAKNTVYELVKRGELQAAKVGNKFRFRRSDVEAYLRGGLPAQRNPGSGPFSLSPAESQAFSAQPGSFILCGQDLILDLLAQNITAATPGTPVVRSYLGSYNGLHALYQGQAHGASAHLWDRKTGTYNLPFLPYVLPGMNLRVIHMALRTVGFYVPRGNPKGLRGWEDLGRDDLVLVNRERGSGMRVLLDQKIQEQALSPLGLAGYSRAVTTHLTAAATVARGGGDFALGSEKAARQVDGIDFIPLQEESYDLVLPRDSMEDPVPRQLLSHLQSPVFRQELEALGGYGTKDMGKILL